MFVSETIKPIPPVARSAAVIIAAALFVLACAGPRPEVRMESKSKPHISVTALEKRVHELINKERRKQGLVQLRWDDDLAGIARSHSRDMAARGYFSHSSRKAMT